MNHRVATTTTTASTTTTTTTITITTITTTITTIITTTIVLDAEVRREAKRVGLETATAEAERNPWLGKPWKDATHFRDVISG